MLESALTKLELKVEQARRELERRNMRGREKEGEIQRKDSTGEVVRRKSDSLMHNGESTITVKKIAFGGEGNQETRSR